MPLKAGGIGLELPISRQPKLLTVEPTIFTSVVEFRPNAVADHDTQVFVERQVACIEDAMNVTPQEQPVRDLMLASTTVCLDVRSI